MNAKLTNNSKALYHFLKTDFIEPLTINHNTTLIFTELYWTLLEAYKYMLLNTASPNLYKFKITKIKTANDIIKPKKFHFNNFPKEIQTAINTYSATELLYSFSQQERNINVYFIDTKPITKSHLTIYNQYINNITMWLYILNKHSSKKCSKNLTIYIYLTDMTKILPPNSTNYILDEINVNTAFTTTCPSSNEISEIVIFRREEWFKVLIHETFHNFGLDFSDMNNTEVSNCILNIFKVKSKVNLYECYTEFWAEIMNSLFGVFVSLKYPLENNVDLFILSAYKRIEIERKYSFFQMIKILDFMKLKYNDLYSDKNKSIQLRLNNYKEETNVLSYYILKTVLFNKYSKFMEWCKTNNNPLLQFNKTRINQLSFCNFIKTNYNTTSMIKNVNNTQDFFEEYLNHKSFLFTNLRMSVCELL
jgi:hypothetical protein